MTGAISASGLEVRYRNELGLSGVDLDVPLGSSLAIIGPNGSGKSTLLGAIAGTIEVSAGAVTVTGPRPSLVLQSTAVDPSLPMTVRDTVRLARYPSLGLTRRFGRRDRQIVDQSLERLNIADLASRQLRDLSGGQRQRVLVAQGLAQDSNVLLLDEPFTGLDAVSQATIMQVIDEEVAEGKAVLVTTHNLKDAKRCDQVLLLDTEPVALGAPSEVLTPAHLGRAFGDQFVPIDGNLLLDDPHHHHH